MSDVFEYVSIIKVLYHSIHPILHTAVCELT